MNDSYDMTRGADISDCGSSSPRAGSRPNDAPSAVLAGEAQWCIVEGDATEELLLPIFAGVDRVCTDGPYGLGGDAMIDDRPYVTALRWARAHGKPVSFFGYPERLIQWIMELGWPPPDEWVTWYPSNAEAKAGVKSKARLPKLVECIAIYGDMPGVRELRRERSAGGKKLAGKKGLLEKRRFSPNIELRQTAQLGDVWTDASPGIGFKSADRLHPNQKPDTLLCKLITLTSVPGDVVLDPFCGSASCGVACLRLGRRFIGIERDPRYAALARERIAAEAAGHSLKSARSGQTSLLQALQVPE